MHKPIDLNQLWRSSVTHICVVIPYRVQAWPFIEGYRRYKTNLPRKQGVVDLLISLGDLFVSWPIWRRQMTVMASRITGQSSVYSTVCSDQQQMAALLYLCAWNLPVTGGYPAQRDSNTEMFPFDDVIIAITQYTCCKMQFKWHCCWWTAVVADGMAFIWWHYFIHNRHDGVGW